MNYYSNLINRDIYIDSLLPYISPQSFDSYCRFNDSLFTWCQQPENIQRYLFKIGQEKLLTSPNYALGWAVKNGSLLLLRFFLDRGATDYNSAMGDAASNGHQEIVNQMLLLGATDYNGAMSNASRNGHQEIVNQMLSLGATNYNSAMAYAASNGHQEIVRLIQQWKDTH